jgi:hypothetical protein
MVTFGYCPVWLKIVIAWRIAALLTWSILPSMALRSAFIRAWSAFTAATCCSAVCLSRTAWFSSARSVLTASPLDWSISVIVEAWLRNSPGLPAVSACIVGSSPAFM